MDALTREHAGPVQGKVPLAVKVVAGIFFLNGARLLIVTVWPALRAGDPSALSELVGGLTPLLIAVGLLCLQSWAWWLATIASTACWVIPAALLGAWNELGLGSEFEDPQAIVRLFTVLAIVSFVAFALLVHRPTRRAFSRRVAGAEAWRAPASPR